MYDKAVHSNTTMRRWGRMLPRPAFALGLMLMLVGYAVAATSANTTEALGKRSPKDGEMSEEQFDYQQEVANYITVAGLTLYWWEYLCTLNRELYMYRPKMLKRPQVVLFLLIRYGTLPAVIVPAYSLWHRFTSSEQCLDHEQITVAVVQFLVSCIFSWRTIAIWRRARWVSIFLATFSLLLFVASIALLYYSHDSLVITGSCRPTDPDGENGKQSGKAHSVNTVMWFYLISMIFDTTTMVLSSYKLVVYANMGRSLDAPNFSDPFEAHRMQVRKQTMDIEQGRRSSAGETLKKVQGRVVPFATFPYRIVRNAYEWWSTLTPLLARLFANGLVYFFVATAFNVVNFVLEAVQSLHSKSFLSLYPPLMCVLCQRMILTEFDAVWAPYDPDLDIPGRQFVDRVVGRGERQSRMSELDRFQDFVTSLEARQTANNSTSSNIRSPSSCPPPGEKASLETNSRFPGAESYTPGQPPTANKPLSMHRPSVATSELSPCESPRASTNHTAAAAAAAAVADSPERSGPLPQLSVQQQQHALRMAGMR